MTTGIPASLPGVTADFLDELTAVVGAGSLLTEKAELRTYECDGLTGYRVTPAAVVLPATTEQVAAVVRPAPEPGYPSSRAGPEPGCRAAHCRSPAASSSAWPR